MQLDKKTRTITDENARKMKGIAREWTQDLTIEPEDYHKISGIIDRWFSSNRDDVFDELELFPELFDTAVQAIADEQAGNMPEDNDNSTNKGKKTPPAAKKPLIKEIVSDQKPPASTADQPPVMELPAKSKPAPTRKTNTQPTPRDEPVEPVATPAVDSVNADRLTVDDGKVRGLCEADARILATKLEPAEIKSAMAELISADAEDLDHELTPLACATLLDELEESTGLSFSGRLMDYYRRVTDPDPLTGLKISEDVKKNFLRLIDQSVSFNTVSERSELFAGGLKWEEYPPEAIAIMEIIRSNYAVLSCDTKITILKLQSDKAKPYVTITPESFISDFSKACVVHIKRAGSGRNAKDYEVGDAYIKYWDQLYIHKLAFRPDMPPLGVWREGNRNFMNQFSGWGVEPKKPDLRIRLMLRTMYKFWLQEGCGGEWGTYKDLMNWIARMMQEPKTRITTYIVMKGKQGTGKGATGSILRTMVGPVHSLYCPAGTSLFGNFNADIENKVFMDVDECFVKKDEDLDKLKTLATGPTMRIEDKNKSAYHTDNILHFAISSNKTDPTPIEPGERRTISLEFNKQFTKHKALAKSVAFMHETDPNHLEVAAGLLWDMLQRDLTGVNAWDQPHMNQTKLDQMIDGLEKNSPKLTFMMEIATEGKFKFDAPWQSQYKLSVIFNEYEEWCKDRGIAPGLSRAFSKLLLKDLGFARGTQSNSGIRVISPSLKQLRACLIYELNLPENYFEREDL